MLFFIHRWVPGFPFIQGWVSGFFFIGRWVPGFSSSRGEFQAFLYSEVSSRLSFIQGWVPGSSSYRVETLFHPQVSSRLFFFHGEFRLSFIQGWEPGSSSSGIDFQALLYLEVNSRLIFIQRLVPGFSSFRVEPLLHPEVSSRLFFIHHSRVPGEFRLSFSRD